jgi:hypothetical protein
VVPNEWNDFLHNILIELLVPNGAVWRWHVLIQPALTVNAVDRERLQLARIDKWLDGINKIESLVFEEVSSRGGEHQQGEAVMSVHCNLHLLVEVGTVPCVDFSVHENSCGIEMRMG